mmetsp:Transcript_78698/g.225486  ORF Transcript_78698/g.225486 Transcript_78698/m.225486 type:complete len:412 (-) Transcript_78698:1078-2313(-)
MLIPDSAFRNMSFVPKGMLETPKKAASMPAPVGALFGSIPRSLDNSCISSLFSARSRWNSSATAAGIGSLPANGLPPKELPKVPLMPSLKPSSPLSIPESSLPSAIGDDSYWLWKFLRASWKRFCVETEALCKWVKFSTCLMLLRSVTRLAALIKSFFSCFSSSWRRIVMCNIRLWASSYRRSQAFFVLCFLGGMAVILTSAMTSAKASSPPYFLIFSSNIRIWFWSFSYSCSRSSYFSCKSSCFFFHSLALSPSPATTTFSLAFFCFFSGSSSTTCSFVCLSFSSNSLNLSISASFSRSCFLYCSVMSAMAFAISSSMSFASPFGPRYFPFSLASFSAFSRALLAARSSFSTCRASAICSLRSSNSELLSFFCFFSTFFSTTSFCFFSVCSAGLFVASSNSCLINASSLS